MNQNSMMEFLTKAKNLVGELKIGEDEKTLLVDLIEALLNQDNTRCQELLATLTDEQKKLDMVHAATEIIYDIRLDSEDEIVQSGDLPQLEQLRKLRESEDHNFADLIDGIFNKSKQANPVPNPVPAEMPKPAEQPVTNPSQPTPTT